MKTILITAYAINPYKGSEDGMGWNYVTQAAKAGYRIVAVTRRNNRPAIEQYIAANRATDTVYNQIEFLYFDWPAWTIFWKKGPMLSMIYYYGWQLTLALWLLAKRTPFDATHNLNFHNDWTPSFLWLLGKPMVWGPVGHHPAIPMTYLKRHGVKEVVKDRALWAMKWAFHHLDPFLYLTKKKAASIWCMHYASARVLGLTNRFTVHPSVSAGSVPAVQKTDDVFTVLSVGRFVPLKGFDMTVAAFAAFSRTLTAADRAKTRLHLVGKGPLAAAIRQQVANEGIADITTISEWMPQDQLHAVYAQASVFLFPSFEGAGMVVPESMRYGLPVVCWDNDGPGMIVHEDSSLKVPYLPYTEAITAFAQKLNALYTNQTLYATEAAMAKNRFEHSLSWEVKAEQLAAFYETALNGHSSTITYQLP